MTASHLLYRLSRCIASEPKARANSAGKWVTVSVPAEVWQAILDKAEKFSQTQGRVATDAGKKA